jgi:ubiquinone/menaquinone biosynthesis C-methylase UbiE
MENPTANGKPTFDPSSYFERAASTYEETSDIMKEIASHLLALSPPLTSQSIIHDNAAGPGIVTGQILALPQFANAEPPTIHATDYSPAMIRALTARSQREAWPQSAIHAQVMDSTDLSPLPSNIFTHTYMAAAIFMVPDPVKAIREIHRTLAPTGVALITTFEKQGSMAPFQDVQRAVRPDLPLWNGPLPAEWLTESKLRDVMQAGGFTAEKVEIKRHSAWVSGEAWSKPGTMPLREALAGSITSGWSEGDRELLEKKLRVEMQSERVKNARYEMKVFVAVARK